MPKSYFTIGSLILKIMFWAPPRLICSADTSILNIWFDVKTLRLVVKEGSSDICTCGITDSMPVYYWYIPDVQTSSDSFA